MVLLVLPKGLSSLLDYTELHKINYFYSNVTSANMHQF